MLPTHDESAGEDAFVDLVEAERVEAFEHRVERASVSARGAAALAEPMPAVVPDAPGIAIDEPRIELVSVPTARPTVALDVPEVRQFSRQYLVSKRALDIAASSVAIALTWPLMLIIGAVIRADSPGPAVFKGERIAKGGAPFRFWKFRTMHTDARDRWPHLYERPVNPNEVESTFYKQMRDPRHTRVGRVIRRTSLDELPNFVSVLRGDVSLVGPRPETFDWAKHYTPEQLAKFSVKPGLTGLAVVSGRNELTVRQTIDLDLEYVRRASFRFDLVILGRTVGAVVRMLGAV